MKGRIPVYFVLLIILLLLAFCADLIFGSVRISAGEFSNILSGDGDSNLTLIVTNFRLPKALTAVLTGSGLAVCGLLMQTLFRNPLAGPYVLGVSSGASLGVALLMMASAWFGGDALIQALPLGNWGMVLAAMAGAFLVMLLVILLSLRLSDSVSILIIGMMFGSATGAIVSVLQYLSDPDSVHSFLVWTFGSISDVYWPQLRTLAPVVVVGVVISITLQKPLNALQLGETQARAIGVPVRRTRYLIIVVTSLLAGALTAFTGPIAFVGVAVPHLARAVFRTPDHRILLPASILCGSILMLVCDILAQLVAAPQVLPINTVTSLFGAPILIWVILRNRRNRNSLSE
ncbi:MAG: iron ABC transporter [Bacteroidetes bacterium GWF2_49_14]|nr:MAG: iron ABC transporter [Bacteroidetes bacterium GWF2_49_14]HBB92063.1 iron ABC transporter [Bacteroidales bacterium]